MIQFKTIIIAAIGLVVLFSGCVGNQDTNISKKNEQNPIEETPIEQTFVDQTPIDQTPDNLNPIDRIQITQANEILQDCIKSYGSATPCLFINLEIKNNNEKSVDVKMIKDTVATKGGKNLDRYLSEAGLSNFCTRQQGIEFNINPKDNQSVSMCYPAVSKNENPTLNIEIMINGDRKEYRFDLTK